VTAPQHLEIAGPATLDNLETTISALSPLLHSTAQEPFVIDLQQMTFVGPTCIALLVAAASRPEVALVERVIPPADPNVRAYLERMDVFNLIPCAHMTEGPRRIPRGFRECRQFATLDDCVETSRELVEAIVERCALSTESKQALLSCIAELAENVHFHAEAPTGGFAAVQSRPKRDLLEVGLVDLGRGIRASLITNPEHAAIETDADAIRQAFELGITATPDRNTGQGLFAAARLLEHNGGQVLVRSGDGVVYDGSKAQATTGESLPGTLVALRINTNRPLDYGRVAHLIGNLKGPDDDLDDLFD
jgi:anti-sigma regulatory factor (Ser/Thr protein kinase)